MGMESFVLKVSNIGYVWPDTLSVTAALGRVWTSEERTLWRKLMHNCYTPMALSAGYAIFGRQLTLREALHLNKSAQAWRDRALEAKGLAPLLGPRAVIEMDAPSNLKQLRDSLLKRGMAPLSWKWLYKQNLSVCRRLFSNGVTAEAIFWANMLARAQPDKKVSAQYLECSRLYGGQPLFWLVSAEASPTIVHTQVERLCRLLPADATPQAIEEASLLVQALTVGFREGDMQLRIAEGSTWRNLLSFVRARNRERELRAAQLYAQRMEEQQELTIKQKAIESSVWAAKIGAGEIYGIQFEELTSHKDLVIEGLAMNHCLKDGGYTEGCIHGTSVILKLSERVTGARATLQLRRSNTGPDSWFISQLQSFGNTAVPMIFWKAAREVARTGGYGERKAA